MKPDAYNPKAKEALARTHISIGEAILKGLMLLLFVVPYTVFFKAVIDNDEPVSFDSVLDILPIGIYTGVFLFLLLGVCIACYFRNEGLRLLNSLE